MRVLISHRISITNSKHFQSLHIFGLARKCTCRAVFWPWAFCFHFQCLPFPQRRRRIPYLWTGRHHLCGRMFTLEISFSILEFAIGYRAQACLFSYFKWLFFTFIHDSFPKWQVLIPILIIMIFFTMLREYGTLFDCLNPSPNVFWIDGCDRSRTDPPLKS